ncbi:MAG: thioredoxin family protein [Candidatus Poseidoniaceae archaeon]|nr:thioredoxin family protein [Candidatus Poseidoniaceae archaeon]
MALSQGLMAINHARFSAFVILSVMMIAVQIPIVTSNSTTTESNTYSVSGGRSILIEEYTATWCPSCAEIDPYLMDFANTHGSRIAMVAYHPNDDVDAFQPLAAQNRINRLQITHPDLASTPTFIVEDGALRVGPDSWPDVNSDILNEEVKRQSYTHLKLDIQQDNETWTATAKVIGDETIDNGQLTIMLIQHQKTVPEGFDNPGGETRDRVLTAIAECDITSSSIISNIELLSAETTTCVDDFSVTFSPENEFFSVLLIHEPTTSQLENGTTGTFGVVEYKSNSVITTQSGINNSIIVIGFILLGFTLVFKMRRAS